MEQVLASNAADRDRVAFSVRLRVATVARRGCARVATCHRAGRQGDSRVRPPMHLGQWLDGCFDELDHYGYEIKGLAALPFDDGDDGTTRIVRHDRRRVAL